MKTKAIIFSFLLLGISFVANAQKQTSGDKSLEFQLAPLGSEPVKINGIRGRVFTDSQTALRLTGFLGGSSTKSITQQASGSLVELSSLSSDRNLTLRPGIEKHLGGNDKLSPYFGGEILLMVDWTRSVSESQWFQQSQVAKTINNSRKSTLGLNAVAGMDYYFGKQLFLGLEMGFGLSKELKGVNRTHYVNPQVATPDSDSKGNSTSLNWGPTYMGTFRIGWLFN